MLLEEKVAVLERGCSEVISDCVSLKARADALEVGNAGLLKECAKIADVQDRLGQAGREIEELGMERSGLFARLGEAAEETRVDR